MTNVETEFEEDSFEDEFEPEEEMEQYKNVPKAPPGTMPYRAASQARQLAMMLQKNLSTQERQTEGDGSAASSSSSSHRVSAFASALADKMLESPEMVRLLEGDMSTAKPSVTPKKLKVLASEFLITSTGKGSISKLTIPGHLYSTLLAEAARLRNEDSIVHLVSTWPFPVLNLNDIEIPVGDYLARETPRSQCVADFVIKGLFYRKVKFCRLQMLVLPKETREGVRILGHFARIPFHFCSRLPNVKIPQLLAAGKLKDAVKYVQEVPAVHFRREINFYAYMRGSSKVTISAPAAVIHWFGRKANVADVHAGLVLQRHAPFIFHFDNIAIINPPDSKAISILLDLIISPETVKKLMIKNKRVFQPDHISYMVSSMSVTLKRFTGLHGFFTKLSSLVGYGPQNFELSDEDRQSISEVFGAWPRLARLNYNDQPIDLPGSFHAMFTPIVGHLTKLSLVRASLTADDIQLIADSKHVDSLQLLRLDYNDLNVAIEQLLTLLSRLRAIQTLRLQACRVKYRNCLRCAEALAHSRTLRTWNFLDNVMYKVRHIKEFVELCSNIVSLRAIGCRPLDYHVLLGKVVIPSKKGLSENKRRELDEFAQTLDLIVF